MHRHPHIHILISPNAYKGTLTPTEAADIIRRAFNQLGPPVSFSTLPLADGGDGTLDVLLNTFHGKLISTRVKGPLGKSVLAKWGFSDGSRNKGKKVAVIEMARASGLALVKGKKQILDATSYGTGQLMIAALNRGCREIYIGVGGTASSDGGAGALEALGLRYFNKQGNRISSKPRELIGLNQVEWAKFDPRLRKTKIFVLCDVINPLLGKTGSALTFGPQKGASAKEVQFLEKVLTLWSKHARNQTKNYPGSGAAGALAFGLSGFAGAKLVEGAPFIMKKLAWQTQAKRADWIVTGEGRLDPTSFSGKVVGMVLKHRKKAKVCGIFGSIPLSPRQLQKRRIFPALQMGAKGLRHPRVALRKAAEKLAENF